MNNELISNEKIQSAIQLFSAWAEARIVDQQQPGVSIGIVYNQELIWSRGFGFANLEKQIPATEKTLYRIASISKLFTATAIMQLRDAGKLNLDEPVRTYLPWFTVKECSAGLPAITVRNLITHTSGLPREAAFAYWSEDYNFPDHQEMVEALPSQSQALPPYVKWKYSNLAVALAGEVVVAVSGMDYADYIQENILTPLDMTNTHIRMDAPGPELLATGYGRRIAGKAREKMPFIDTKAITPAANLATSVEDLAKFAMLQFRKGPAGGAQILDGWTLAEMQRAHWVKPDWTGGWGLGFMLWRLDGKTYFGHSGGLQGFTTHLAICPEDKIAAIALTNSVEGRADLYTQNIYKWAAPAIRQAVEKSEAPKGAGYEKFTGKYRNAWSDTEVILMNGTLWMIDPLEDDPLESATKLIPEGENVFHAESSDGFGIHGEPVEFELNTDGTVRRIRAGYNYRYPVAHW